jgi:hypothetical protein
MHTPKQQYIYIFLLISGPTIYISILIGFKENDILPIGGGKNGE